MAHGPVLYLAPMLALGLVLLFLYRKCFEKLERCYYRRSRICRSLEDVLDVQGTDVALLAPATGSVERSFQTRAVEVALAALNYYTLLYLVCGYLIWDEYASSFALLYHTGLLDPDLLKAAFVPDEASLPIWWKNEVHRMTGEESWGLLRFFSLSSPLFLALTFLVSAYNTGRHVRLIWSRGGLLGNPGVDQTIVIIALPMIACMMSYRSVSRMWMICSNSKVGSLGYAEDFDGNRTWLARLVLCQNMYTTNFMVSDVYESFALLEFASLTLQVISSQRKKQGSHDSAENTSFSKGVSSLTNQGIYLFIFTCVVEASYHLGTTSIEAFGGGDATRKFNIQVYRIKEPVHFFFLGMGAIASTAAIGNVVIVELTFEELLHHFRPSPKFWSTKILVSIAFIQSLLLYLPPLSYLSITEQYLFYASAMCIECFGISMFHLLAWVPGESWYADLREFGHEIDQ